MADFFAKQRERQAQMMNTLLPILIKNRLAQQQAQQQQGQFQGLLKQFPGMGGQGTQGVQGGQRGQLSPFISKPQLSLGPQGTTLGITQVENPEIARRQASLQRATGLRKEFDASKAFKDFQIVDRSAKALQSAFKLSVNPATKSRIASDQALGVLFQKMLDPASVVRESEYARTPEGASFFNRLKALVPRLVRGGLALQDEDRAAIFAMSQKLLIEGQKTFNSHVERFQQIADLMQVDPKLVFGNIKQIDIKGVPVDVEEILNSIRSGQLPLETIGLDPNQKQEFFKRQNQQQQGQGFFQRPSAGVDPEYQRYLQIIGQ